MIRLKDVNLVGWMELDSSTPLPYQRPRNLQPFVGTCAEDVLQLLILMES